MSDSETIDGKPIPHFMVQAFPGLGIGLLVGLLVGLSISPVVSGLLTTLGGLLAAMLGIQPSGEGGLLGFRVSGARIGAFGFACVLGVLGGMTLRVREVLAVPIQKQVEGWVAAGYAEKEARQFVAFQKTGMQSSESGTGKLEAVSGDMQKSGMSVLFNALSDVDLCEKVKLGQFGDDPKESSSQMLRVYRRLNLDDGKDKRTPLYRRMGKLADHLETLPVESRYEALKSVEDMVCAIQAIE